MHGNERDENILLRQIVQWILVNHHNCLLYLLLRKVFQLPLVSLYVVNAYYERSIHDVDTFILCAMSTTKHNLAYQYEIGRFILELQPGPRIISNSCILWFFFFFMQVFMQLLLKCLLPTTSLKDFNHHFI